MVKRRTPERHYPLRLEFNFDAIISFSFLCDLYGNNRNQGKPTAFSSP
jgi:hypothetical protein